MPKIIVLPHPDYAPQGSSFQADAGRTLCDALHDNRVDIDQACGKVGACTTCHVVVSEGFGSLNALHDNEEDMLDRAWGLHPRSRLACQAVIGEEDLVIAIPAYSINHAKEG
jgi:2Fe-2S ferredoxin